MAGILKFWVLYHCIFLDFILLRNYAIIKKYQEILILNKMSSVAIHHSFLKDVGPSSNNSNKIDLQGLLELLNTTNDVNLQIKVFSALSAYLMFNKETNVDIIIKFSAVYDRIHNVLAKGLPRKAANALNFLSALLYVDVEEDATTKRRTLALYAKNMTRTSGCLGVMTNMFTNCMMYHDTWKALCQCLAVACSGCEINQSYCTHLIPVCIQKCSQTNIDIFLVLQSLVTNHNRNIQLFLECSGTSIFTRELLHYDTTLQLLTTVVQRSTVSSTLLRNTKVLEDLQDFLRLYGPGSQIGQKAMIILNHIASRSRGLDSRNTKSKEQPKNRRVISSLHSVCRDDMTINKVGNELDDTKTLMQNVLNEVFKYRQDEPGNLIKVSSKVGVNSVIRGASSMNLFSNRSIHRRKFINQTKKLMQHELNNRKQCNIATDMSFSFLKNNFNHGLNRSGHHKNDAMAKTKSHNDRTQTNTNTLSIIEKEYSNYMTVSNEKPTQDLQDFKPIFSSTPKHEREISKQMNWSKTSMCQSNLATQSQMHKQRPTKVQKRKPNKLPRNLNKDLRNRSLSSRFFSAINDSCTTLVKTVANIFKKKETPDSSKDNQPSHSSSKEDNRSCSYSFLNYMQKRDAVLNSKLLKRNKDCSEFSLNTKSCETCDDTEVLKKKLAKDVHLKQTVNKLKVGINLYGCDFKKISRTMWPQESYMTPVVLYNLYRKLLLK